MVVVVRDASVAGVYEEFLYRVFARASKSGYRVNRQSLDHHPEDLRALLYA